MGGSWQRHGGWSGIAFVVVWAVGFVVRGETQMYDAPTADLRRYWQESGDRYIAVQYVVLLAAFVLFLPYAVALTEHLGRAEGEPRLWSRVSLFGAVLLLAFTLGAGAAWGTLAFAIDDLSDQELRLLMRLDIGAFQTEGFGLGLFVFAASLVAVGTGRAATLGRHRRTGDRRRSPAVADGLAPPGPRERLQRGRFPCLPPDDGVGSDHQHRSAQIPPARSRLILRVACGPGVSARPSAMRVHQTMTSAAAGIGPTHLHAVRTLVGTYPTCYITSMDAVLHALADESRRTVLEILRSHPASAGDLAEVIPIARPGVSRHLRVLREAGLVEVRQEAQRRIYSLRPEALMEVDEWLADYRALWQSRLDALHTEIARGKKARR